MIRTLTVKGRTGLFDTPSFLVSENESLTIKIKIVDEIRVGKFRLIVKHGEHSKQYTLDKTDEITLNPVWLKMSGENLEFSLVFVDASETQVLKNDYQIEPLKLETINGNFMFTAWLQEIERKQKELDERLILAEEKLKAYESEGVPLVEIDE